MRIIAGQWRGRKLATPKGETTRPTADRARETLFSMLVSRIGKFEGLRVLDLFAGSGALGLEALSRGAAHCVFVEQDSNAVEVLHRNISALGAIGAEVRAKSVMRLGPAIEPYDLILLDPPYGTGAGAVALDKLGRLGWIAPMAWIAVETAHDDRLDVAGFEIDDVRNSGKARLHLLRPANAVPD